MSELPPQPSRDSITPAILDALKDTKPWVTLLAVLGFVGVGFMYIGALALGIMALVMKAPAAPQLALAALYVVMATLYLFAARLLFKYSQALGAMQRMKTKTYGVERALDAQRSFWKYAGIMTICMMVLSFIAIPIAIAMSIIAKTPATLDEPRASSSEPEKEETPSPLASMFASSREKQMQTMRDMRRIATALEARATDVNSYPQTMSIDQIAALLEPVYIRNMPRNDAWGNPFRYESVCTSQWCNEYYFASGGANGQLERASPAAYKASSGTATTDRDEDIVFANGTFLRYP